ncbi:MAG: bifunctional UDP-sugar hydrolase/5'-nucleotidase [Bacteroidota bacterium]
MNRLIPLIFIINLFAFGIARADFGNDTTTVVILSVNDIHAKIDNFPKFKALIDDIRKEYDHVLVVSAGDMFTGNPVVDQFPDKGYPIIELMNKTGFSIGTIGNHEFDYGQEILLKRIRQAEFPLISANIASGDPNGINPEPYRILTLKNGLRVGFVGVIQLNPAGLPDSHPSKLAGLTFTDGIKKMVEYRYLRDSCNIFIGLTHLGFEADVELAGLFGEPDVILGGHSHTIVSNPKEYNGVLVMQAGSNLKNLAKITLRLVDGKVISKQAETISIVNYPHTDSSLLKLVDRFNDNKELNRVIGIALNDILDNDELGSLVTDGMSSLDAVEVAFQNNGGIRIDKIAKGNITIKDVYKLDPFGNEIILFNLSIPEIKSLILTSFNRDKQIDLQTSGLSYTVITDKDGTGTDVRLIMSDSREPDASRIFAVGLSSYIASSYDFEHADPGRSLYITTAQALINHITIKKELDYSGIKRTFTEKPAQ